MPTILRVGRYRFFFFSNEGNEPPHIHVEAGEALGKVWLDPVSVARQGRFSAKDIGDIIDIVQAHQQNLLEAWHGYFHRP